MAEVNVVEQKDAGRYMINSGPYYQQFLDGYYPYHVSLTVNYPAYLLDISRVTPEAQPLFRVFPGNNQLAIDTWFEGVLNIEIEFSARSSPENSRKSQQHSSL
jgi:hypothetical protein